MSRIVHILLVTVSLLPPVAAQPLGDGEAPGLALAGREATQTRRILGFTREARRILVSAETAGRLLEVLVAEGESVPEAEADAAGTVVARVECERLRLAMKAEEAALALAREDAEYHARERERVLSLDRGLTTDENRLARTHAANAAQLAAQAAQVAVALAADAVGRCEVRAAPGLFVLRTRAQPGERMQVGTPILELADLSVLEVDLRLSEEEIRVLRAEDEPVVRVLDQPQLTNGHGLVRVRSFVVFPEFDPTSRKRRVELRLAGDDLPEASGGLRVELALQVLDSAAAWSVPVSYLIERAGDTVVLTTEGPRQVTILRREGTEAIVLGGGLSAKTLLVQPQQDGGGADGDR